MYYFYILIKFGSLNAHQPYLLDFVGSRVYILDSHFACAHYFY